MCDCVKVLFLIVFYLDRGEEIFYFLFLIFEVGDGIRWRVCGLSFMGDVFVFF